MVQRRVCLKSVSLNLACNDTDSWTYRGEGKTGLVITNNNGLALKLRKVLGLSDDYLNVYIRNSQYVGVCIAPVFGQLLCYGQIVQLPPRFTASVVSKITNRRSSLKQSQVDLNCPYGLLMADACALGDHTDVITVEIKPKAYLRTFVDTQTPITSLRCCRFCSNIEKRYADKKIPALTRYCPRDMFSHKPSNVARALDCLLDVPLSYLTVHKNGKRVFDEDHHNVTELLHLTGFDTRPDLIKVIVQILLGKNYTNLSVLQIIENAQLINKKSIPELNDMYNVFTEAGLDIDEEISKWLDSRSKLNQELLTLLQAVVKFSISVIAQDVSIMVTISRTVDPAHDQVVVDGKVYSYKVSIVDVDLKSVKKLPVYLRQEKGLMMTS